MHNPSVLPSVCYDENTCQACMTQGSSNHLRLHLQPLQLQLFQRGDPDAQMLGLHIQCSSGVEVVQHQSLILPPNGLETGLLCYDKISKKLSSSNESRVTRHESPVIDPD